MEDPLIPAPVSIGTLISLRKDVANALEVLREAIEAEAAARDDWGGSIPAHVTQPVLRRAIGWRVFCADAFVTLFADQVKREMPPVTEDDP